MSITTQFLSTELLFTAGLPAKPDKGDFIMHNNIAYRVDKVILYTNKYKDESGFMQVLVTQDGGGR